jgi:ABC-type bacteriocin/lantibiotic exporter with double-glycine peptidase domain
VSRGAADVTAAAISLETLAAIDGQQAPPPYGGARRIPFSGKLALRGVNFGYGTKPLFRDLDFDIGPGEHVIILGPNGAGKTTVLNLLLGIIRPDSGIALADSIPYADLDLEDLRRNVGVVLQRAAFFHGTIRANICYGHEDATEEDMVAAAHLACADEFVGELPLGYDTILGDSGITLSGGECQRLAIARAILRRPRLLVLDEPTNHLDAAVVGKLLASLRQLPDSPAILIVSHDPRIAAFVSRTYQLRAGQLHVADSLQMQLPAESQG